jgi:hypothetical protein
VNAPNYCKQRRVMKPVAGLGVFGKSDPGLQYFFTGYLGTSVTRTRTRIPGMRVQ